MTLLATRRAAACSSRADFTNGSDSRLTRSSTWSDPRVVSRRVIGMSATEKRS